MNTDISEVNPKENIIIKGARLHNLKNIDVVIPRNKLVVITGLSGSGKSSLAFDTLYAEGQRRYVESLSSYARQFLGRLNKPKVDYIKGIAPAIAIEQKVNSTNPRSTVGTTTEIYDYLKLLFARIGKTYSPVSGLEVKKDTVTDVLEYLKTFDEGEKLLLLAPIYFEEGRTIEDKLKTLNQQGYARVKINDSVVRIDEATAVSKKDTVLLVVDRIITKNEEDHFNRLADAIQTAFFEGKGECSIETLSNNKNRAFSNKFELDGISFLEPNVHLFSFNNPYGACPKCEGYGDIVGIDDDLVIPNTGLSVYENAIFPWRGDSMSWYKEQLVNNSHKFNFPIHKPYFELTAAPCDGKRLRPESNYIKIASSTITDLVEMPLDKLTNFFKQLEINDHDTQIANRLLKEINNRLAFLANVGLDYLTLNRKSNTLSGGESQRINLATSLGSSLVGSMYILDEPSIGLHPKDTDRLIQVLKSLRDLGNTVIVVEHDEDIMKAAETIIDIGPEAGTLGGHVVAAGNYAEILASNSRFR